MTTETASVRETSTMAPQHSNNWIVLLLVFTLAGVGADCQPGAVQTLAPKSRLAMSKNVPATGEGQGHRHYGDLLTRRPFNVPVPDAPAYRGWYARRLAEQIIASADVGAFDKLEHEAKSLLAAVRTWRGYGAPPTTDDDGE